MLRTRILTAIVWGGAVIGAVFFLPRPAAAAAFGLLWLAGSWEWAGLAGAARLGRAAYTAAFAVPMLVIVWRWPPPAAAIDALLAIAVAAWAAAAAGILRYPRPIRRATVWIAGWPLLLPSWLSLVAIHRLDSSGPALCMTVLAVVWAADIGAYFAGRAVGRRKLAPRVSPGKTWEGVAGGAALAVLTAFVASRWLSVPLGWLLPLAAVTALVSVIGDLTVSMLKRNAGLKDSGRLLPGHGGVLDRIDGLNAALPVFALGLRFGGLL